MPALLAEIVVPGIVVIRAGALAPRADRTCPRPSRPANWRTPVRFRSGSACRGRARRFGRRRRPGCSGSRRAGEIAYPARAALPVRCRAREGAGRAAALWLASYVGQYGGDRPEEIGFRAPGIVGAHAGQPEHVARAVAAERQVGHIVVLIGIVRQSTEHVGASRRPWQVAVAPLARNCVFSSRSLAVSRCLSRSAAGQLSVSGAGTGPPQVRPAAAEP